MSQLAGSGWSSFIKNSDLLLRTLTGSRVINAVNSTPEIFMKIIKACFYIARVEIARSCSRLQNATREDRQYNIVENTNERGPISAKRRMLSNVSRPFYRCLSLLWIRIGMRSFQIPRGRDFLFPNGGMHSLR